MTPPPILRVGHSPDPDDAFMFCALAKGAVRIRDYQVEHVLEDIESLNDRALAGELPITAISAHAYLSVADRYWIMATGASMGEGYGPVVVSRKAGKLKDLEGRRVAIPGPRTTAALLARCYIGEFEPVVVPFDQVFETVEEGRAEAGVVIHEGQLTYEARGFHLLSDFGIRFEEEHGLPLPLGLDVVRRDLGRDLAIEVNRGDAGEHRLGLCERGRSPRLRAPLRPRTRARAGAEVREDVRLGAHPRHGGPTGEAGAPGCCSRWPSAPA